MKVTRDVILDLIPLVLAGEASADSRALVDEHLAGDPELAERVRLLGAEGFAPIPATDLPPDLELKSLRRTRRLIGLLRWLFGLGVALTAVSLGMRIEFEQGRMTAFHFLVAEHPLGFGIPLAAGLGLLAAYYTLRRRLRAAAP